MSGLWEFLGSQPLLTLFLVISLGYAVGEVSIAGFQLGVGAVLFVGLLLGALAPAAAPPGILSTVGLVLFCYGIGIQYGKAFFKGLKAPSGRRQLLIGAIATVGTAIVAAIAIRVLGVSKEIGLGIFSGALTSTPTLESVVHAAGSDDPVAGYGVAYPFGVFGPILFMYILNRLIRPTFPARKRRGTEGTELLVTHAELVGKRLSEVTAQLPQDVQVIAVRHDGYNQVPHGEMRLAMGDELLIEAKSAESLQQAQRLVGEGPKPHAIVDVADLDDLTVYVSRRTAIGQKLDDLKLSENLGCTVVSVIRGDSELFPNPGMILEAGDQLRLVAEPGRAGEIQDFFGNSAYSVAEVSYLALGLGMVLGVLLGLVPFPLPGIGSFSFGPAGGALIVALILGWLGRTGNLSWKISPSANLILRNFGLTLFLAVAGMRSAETFFKTVQATGLSLLGMGILVTLVIVLLVTLLGYVLLRIKFDELLGIIAGATGNPAVLAYAAKAVPTNQPEVGYAIVYPSTTIIKIIAAQVLYGLLR
jgi:putative transport protein